jgi:Fe2+ or Zn2+ uptake regulation protein
LLLRQIPQIEKETNTAYIILDNLLKTSIKLRKNTVVSTLQAFDEFSLVNQVKEDKKSVQKIFIRLKEQINGLKTLAEADSENDDILQFGEV